MTTRKSPPTPQVENRPLEGEDSSALGAGIDFADPNSRWAPFYLRLSHVAAILVLVLVFLLLSSILLMWHTDVWAHLRFGEYMARERQLPTHEPFPESFADHEAAYVNYQWIAQLGAYLVFAAGQFLAGGDFEQQLGGGVVFLQAAHALIVVARLVLLLLAFRRLTASLPFAVIGVLAVTVMSLFNHLQIIRPQILGELFFAALLLALSRPVLSRRALWLVPPVFLLWVNSHGSFPIGFVLLGTALLGQMLSASQESWRQARNIQTGFWPWLMSLPKTLLDNVQTRRLAAVLVLSLFAAMINPHGPMLFWHSWELGGNPNIRSMDEWKSLPVTNPAGYVYLVSVVLLLPLFRLSPLAFTPTQVLLLLIFGLQSLAHVRILVWWIMVVTWVAMPHAHAVYRLYLPPLLEERSAPNLARTILVSLLTCILLLWASPVQWLLSGAPPAASRRVDNVTPIRIAEDTRLKEALANNIGAKVCLFTSETQGDFLLWDPRLRGLTRIFCYTHVHLLPPAHWRECLTVKFGDNRWQEILDEYNAEFIAVEPKDYHQHLIEQIRASGRWTVLSASPIFFAQRRR